MTVAEALNQAILAVLQQATAPMSLPRLGKRLGLGASVLMRALTLMGDASLGGQPGPGWVQVVLKDARWTVGLTDAGRSFCAEQAMAELPPTLWPHAVRRFPADVVETDQIAAEVPVALVFNGISHAVMMATPQDLEAFALGFALSEGILDSVADCYGMKVQSSGAACEVQLDVSSRCFQRLKERRRNLAGRTGCGVCGIDSLAALDLEPTPMAPQAWAAQLKATTVLQALQAMPPLQVLNAACGSLHAAGWATPDGVLTDVLEDVGRHNALDKLLGQLAQAGRLAEPGFVVMSSRASYELVHKCARLNVAVLATISAPTTLAIRIADTAGLQLWGLCRDPRAVRYTAGC